MACSAGCLGPPAAASHDSDLSRDAVRRRTNYASPGLPPRPYTCRRCHRQQQGSITHGQGYRWVTLCGLWGPGPVTQLGHTIVLGQLDTICRSVQALSGIVVPDRDEPGCGTHAKWDWVDPALQ
jgi:hypothetical protein